MLQLSAVIEAHLSHWHGGCFYVPFYKEEKDLYLSHSGEMTSWEIDQIFKLYVYLKLLQAQSFQ